MIHQEPNMKEIVSQAHSILDGMGIPSAIGANCDDPDCNSQLIHRLKDLQNASPPSVRDENTELRTMAQELITVVLEVVYPNVRARNLAPVHPKLKRLQEALENEDD